MIQEHNIVARFPDGSVLKGVTSDFTPLKTFFNLKLDSGETKVIDTDNLRQYFLLKNLSPVITPMIRIRTSQITAVKKLKSTFMTAKF